MKNDFFRHLGHLLDGVFCGTIKQRLEVIIKNEKSLTPQQAKSVKEMASILDEVAATATKYSKELKRISKARVA